MHPFTNRFRLLAAPLLALVVSACSQAPVAPDLTTELATQRRTAQDDAALYAVVDRSGVYVGSVTDGYSSESYNALEKFSRGGARTWQRRVPVRPGDDYATLDALERGPDAHLYAAYSSVKEGEAGPIQTQFVRKYTPTGGVAWTRDVTALNLLDFGYDALGNLYFIVQPGRAFELVKYAPSGIQLFRRTLAASDVRGFRVLPDGSSRVLDNLNFQSARVLALDAQGAPLWEATFGGQPLELAVAPDGSSFVAGYGETTDPLSNTRVLLNKYTASGVLAWERSASSSGYRDLGALEPDGAGGVLVGLSGKDSLSSSADRDVFVSRFSGSGAQVWTKTFVSPEEDYLYDIATLSASEFYLVGSTRGDLGRRNQGGSDAFVMRVDGNGARVWTR